MCNCPNGHGAIGDDGCQRCGVPSPARCPERHDAIAGRFCGVCGTRTSHWCVDIRPDLEFFARRQPDGSRYSFPAWPTTRRIDLLGDRVLVGRRSRSRNLVPEIDLSEEPVDPAVSREHAELLAHPDGSWTVTDLGSANGTFADGPARRLEQGIAVPLVEGDSFHVGVWTTVTLRRTRDPTPEGGPSP